MSPRRPAAPWWHILSDEALLGVRLCDLGLRIEASPLAPRVARLHDELARAGLRARPHVWFSTDWFTPHGVAGFAVPFYLAHPRLLRLERRFGQEVEGTSERDCLKLLRHEAGHAVDNAYQLHRRASWREHFGPFGTPYRVRYRARPRDPAYVTHLEGWYAQSHPGEDFAETFAVWLTPHSGWRRRYAATPALRKLLYVNALMHEVGPQTRCCRLREHTDSLAKLRYTLADHYRRRRARYTAARAGGRGTTRLPGGGRGRGETREFYR